MGYKNLVFEGGVVHGLAYGNALQELANKNILKDIKRVGGTSAGAITALLLSLGYTPKEITEIIITTNFNDFTKDGGIEIAEEVKNIVSGYGLHNGNNFVKWIKKYINNKSKHFADNITFEQHQKLVESFSNEGYKELYVIGTNLSYMTEVIYSYKTTPKMKIADATRISMSVPLFFEAVKIKCQDCQLNKPSLECDNGNKECLHIDGGCLWNYPISIFDDKSYLENPENGEVVQYYTDRNQVFNHETLGFRLGIKDKQSYLSEKQQEHKEIKDFKTFLSTTIDLFQQKSNDRHLHQNDWNRTIFIDTGKVEAFNFNINDIDKKFLLKSGKDAVINYFIWKDSLLGKETTTGKPV